MILIIESNYEYAHVKTWKKNLGEYDIEEREILISAIDFAMSQWLEAGSNLK